MIEYDTHTCIPFEGNAVNSFCVLLIRNEIAYDINVQAVAMAKIRFFDLNPSVRKDIVLSSKQTDWLDRNIKNAIAKVKASIRFAVPRQSQMASNEILESDHQYAIPLQFEKEWTEEPSTLCNAIHEYVVKKCLEEWCLMACADMLPIFQAKAEEALTEVHDVACSFVYDMQNPLL